MKGFAQEPSPEETPALHEVMQVSLMGIAALPSPEFEKAVDNKMAGVGAGVAANLLFNPFQKTKPSPVFIGVDFSYLTFGRDKQEETATAPPYKTSFNHFTVGPAARLFLNQKPQGFIPFIEGMGVVKIYNTRTKIDKDVIDIIIDEEEPEVIHKVNDVGLGYGIGLGFYTRAQRLPDTHPQHEDQCSFSLRLLYLWGNRSSYVKRGSLQVIDGNVFYEQAYTQTNMLMLQLGICLY